MKPNSLEEARRWLRQGQNDLAIVRMSLREGFFSHACFMSQQAAEKGLKALAFLKGERYVVGHSVRDLLERVAGDYPVLLPFRGQAARLDQYYVPTRYPDALPGGVPFEAYGRDQADEAASAATAIIEAAARLIAEA